MTKTITITDFDLTLTQKHTFSTNGFGPNDATPSARATWMEKGKKDAATNLKSNLDKGPYEFNEERIFAIATFHNNADYIMGYVTVLLEKKIETMAITKHGNVAIMRCRVDNSDSPLFISYIPVSGHKEYQKIYKQLRQNGKNEQLLLLRHALVAAEQMNFNDVVNFYDDDMDNTTLATQLPNIRTHLVSRNTGFNVLRVVEPRTAEIESKISESAAEPSQVVFRAQLEHQHTLELKETAEIEPKIPESAAEYFPQEQGPVELKETEVESKVKSTATRSRRLSQEQKIQKLKRDLEWHEKQFTLLLENLQAERKALLKRAETDREYQPIARKISVLCTLLRGKLDFFHHPSSELFERFQKTCLYAVDSVQKSAAQHRGWHKIDPILRGILGVLLGLTGIFALIVDIKFGYTQTFFATPETNTSQTMRRFEEELKIEFEDLKLEAGF